MLKKILAGIAIVIVVFVVIVAVQPADFVVQRSTTISAPPAAVFDQVNDFHNWEAWSPWAKLDPAMKTTYDGSAAGIGSSYKWVGNKEVGEGSMTITESHPTDLVRIKLEFLTPFAASNMADFSFKPQGDQTVVTWTMTGKNNFVAKAFCLFMSMDKMVGGDFEKGLAQMKSLVERTNKK